MNDTFCEICNGTADFYTTEVNGNNIEDRGATESSQCKRKTKCLQKKKINK